MRSLRLPLFLTLVSLLSACGGNDVDDEPYDTLQDCYDDHHKVEAFDIQTSIKICCLDHPIGNPPVGPDVVCGDTQQACEDFVDAEIADADVTLSEISAACAGYLVDREN